MKLKKWMLIPVIIVLGLLVFIFAINLEKKEDENIPKPIKTISLKEINENLEIEYLGTLQPAKLKKIGFKIPGKIQNINITDGEEINKGDLIGKLESKELQMAADAARNTLATAENSLNFISDNYEKMIQIHAGGGISTQELEKYKLEKQNAENLYNNAKIDYENKNIMVNDSVLRSDMNGYIIDIMYEEGEMIPAGHPLVIIGSSDLEVNFGLSQEDMTFVKIGSSVRIVDEDKEYQGAIKSINKAPDSSVRTYETKVGFKDGLPEIPIGSIVKIYVHVKEETGIWIPMDIILNDGEDYVFVVDNENLVHKRIIKIDTLKNTKVRVLGLVEDEVVVSEGFRNLQENDIVTIQN